GGGEKKKKKKGNVGDDQPAVKGNIRREGTDLTKGVNPIATPMLTPTKVTSGNNDEVTIGNYAKVDEVTEVANNIGNGSSYARILIEIDTCNEFSDNLVMVMPNLKGNRYTKETIRVEYEWKPPCCSTCFIFGHSLDDCPKVPKQVVDKMDKGKGGSFRVDEESFIEIKKKNSGGNNRGNKKFKPVSMKPKPEYPKAKQSTEGANQKTTPSDNKKNVSTSSNGTFSLSNLFRALNVEN
ncbi:putative ribonuclease H-like domain-containing protein, partial [Tanacetum coccineum]